MARFDSASLAELADSIVAVFSPRAAIERRMYRDGLAIAISQEKRTRERQALYAAAKTTRLTGPWSIASPNVNDIIGASSPAVRARVRQLVRDFPYFARAVDVGVDYVVGPQITFQSKVKTSAGDKFDKKAIVKIEDAVKWWMDEADAAGKLHFNEIVRLTKRQDLEAGEFLLVKTYPRNSNRYLPFTLQVYEADWLTTIHDTYTLGRLGADPDATEVRQGIHYRKLTGEVLGYWFADPENYLNDTYIPASQVLHGFKMVRPQQLRGISSFAPGVLLAHDLEDYLQAEIDGAKMAAKYLAIVKRSDPAAFQNALIAAGMAKDTTAATGGTQRIESLENTIIEYLKPGEDITLASHNRPGDSFGPFTRLLLTMFSIVSGVPYELLTGDYQGLNFATAKIVRSDYAQQLRPIVVRHIRQSCQPVIQDVIDMAVLSRKIDLPGYDRDPRHYWEAEWQPPGMEAVDPLREAKSYIEAIAFGLESPQAYARAKGRDVEDVLNETAAFIEMIKEKGLEEYFAKAKAANTSMKSNPAAIAGA